MFNVADILELVVDGFNERPFPQQDFVVQVHERVLHVLLEFGHKVYVVNEKPFEKLLQWFTVVHVSRRERPLYYLATVVYHYMQLEPVEPSHRALALGSPSPHRPVAVRALCCMTSAEWSR